MTDDTSGRPLFSVVIPTRDRPETLMHSLRTCVDQDFEDFEVIVADNFGSPQTREIVEQFASPRIRYVRSDAPLAMSANWENAVACATGHYVTVVGDDDGLMPYALRELAHLIEVHNQPTAIRWEHGRYLWPTIAMPEDANLLFVPLTRRVRRTNGLRLIPDILNFKVAYDVLPCIYNSIVRRDLIEEHRRQVGRMFPTIYPDVYSAFAFAWLAQDYLSVDLPMSLTGVSGRSNGVASVLRPEGSPIANEFWRLNAEFGFVPHPRVPHLPLLPVHMVDSFEYARQLVYPASFALTYDRQAMTERYLASIPECEPQVRAGYREAIRASLADRPDLQAWFDSSAPDAAPAAPPRFRPAELGFDGTWLRMSTADLPVTNIADAVALATRILGVDAGPVTYGLASVHEVAARLARCEKRAVRAEAARDKALAQRDAVRLRNRKLKQRHRARQADRKRAGQTPPGWSNQALLRQFVRKVRRRLRSG
jgi:hypothetical protein